MADHAPLNDKDYRMLTKRAAYTKGLNAESLVAQKLQDMGWQIKGTRYKTKFGEVDLIAENLDTVSFIEVKARKKVNEGLISLTKRSQKRIIAAARVWLSQYNDISMKTIRFDLAVVCGNRCYLYENYFQDDADFF
ncbi:YraN family protein [Polycladidibacter stylochi]|uniref:YraN family protein n=1 Tax=Polycladidibacter stylochi TaxID=1807766 RepID=UPI00082C67FD|nr:YraN family protein [Pseudovibrio stylochi]